MPPKVLHLSTFDARGGAGRAAYALHRAMVDSGVDSTMRVAMKSVEDATVIADPDLRFRINNELEHRIWRLERPAVDTWRSPAYLGSMSARKINRHQADVVNIHWATDGFLSIRQIGLITKPVVWSLYDMWPFSGTEHYGSDATGAPDAPNARWRSGYTKANRPAGSSGIDLDRLAWARKRKWWAAPRHVVGASTWLTHSACDSALMHNWPTHQIPHVIDCESFTPMPMSDARRELGLPQEVPLILFLSSGGIADKRKGWDLLDRALITVRAQVPDVEVVIVGPKSPDYVSQSGVPLHWSGGISGNTALRLHYNAANVTAVPSREDNMPLTAMEAQSCGRPVAAFNIGGLPDIVDHNVTGSLTAAEDIEGLAVGLVAALHDSMSGDTWGKAARYRALAKWSREPVVSQYLSVYEEALR